MADINFLVERSLFYPEMLSTKSLKKKFSSPKSKKVTDDRKVNQLGGRELLTRFNIERFSPVRGI